MLHYPRASEVETATRVVIRMFQGNLRVNANGVCGEFGDDVGAVVCVSGMSGVAGAVDPGEIRPFNLAVLSLKKKAAVVAGRLSWGQLFSCESGVLALTKGSAVLVGV